MAEERNVVLTEPLLPMSCRDSSVTRL